MIQFCKIVQMDLQEKNSFLSNVILQLCGLIFAVMLSSFMNARKTVFSIYLCISQSVYIDPRGRPTVTAGSDHYFRTCCLSVRPSPLFKNHAKQNNFEARIVIATGGTVSLAEWIIDGTNMSISASVFD